MTLSENSLFQDPLLGRLSVVTRRRGGRKRREDRKSEREERKREKREEEGRGEGKKGGKGKEWRKRKGR